MWEHAERRLVGGKGEKGTECSGAQLWEEKQEVVSKERSNKGDKGLIK